MPMRHVKAGTAALLAATALWTLHAAAQAATFAALRTGIGYDPQRFRLLRETSTVNVLDWPVFALAEYRQVAQGDRFEFNIVPPDGSFTWVWHPQSPQNYSGYFLRHLIPLAGTPNEERTGTWQITVSHRGQQNRIQLNVVAADPSALEAIRSDQAAKPDDFVANYRLGAAASMFGHDELAVSSLNRAAQLARRSPYPHVALCRHHLRQARKDEARQACATARGLLLGYEDQSLSGWLQSEIAKLMQAAE